MTLKERFFWPPRERLPCWSSPNKSFLGSRWSGMQTTWPAQCSWVCIKMVWMLERLARVSTSLSVILSCHFDPPAADKLEALKMISAHLTQRSFCRYKTDQLPKPLLLQNGRAYSIPLSVNEKDVQFRWEQHHQAALDRIKEELWRQHTVVIKEKPNACFLPGNQSSGLSFLVTSVKWRRTVNYGTNINKHG